MSKRISILGVFVLFALILMVSGCSTGTNESGKGSDLAQEKESDGSQEALKGNISILGGSVGGVWSVYAEGIAEAVRREFPGSYISAEPGSVGGNPVVVGRNEIEYALVEGLTGYFAYQGTYGFEEEFKDIRAVAAIIPNNSYQAIAKKDVEFNSVEEVISNKAGIRISPGTNNSLGHILTTSIFEANGANLEDVTTWGGIVEHLSGRKAYELAADNRMDGVWDMKPEPSGDIMEASTTLDLKFIELGDKTINHLVENFGMFPHVIKAGTYDFQDQDYKTAKTPTILITNANIPDEEVYKVTRAIYNQLEYLYDVHNSFSDVTDETIAIVGQVPMHPGAEKFYKEKGILK